MNDIIYPTSKRLHVFDYSEFGVVRIHIIGGMPYYLSNDVTRILGYKNNKEAINQIVNCYDKIYIKLYDNIGECIFINDCGLYCLCLHSNKEYALDFKTALSTMARDYSLALYNDRVYNVSNVIKNNWNYISIIIKEYINIVNGENRNKFIKNMMEHLCSTKSFANKDIEDTYVYFIKDEHGNTKIGISKNIEKRLSTLQTGNADNLGVIDYIGPFSRKDALYIERELHNKFNLSHVNGEWFEITDYEIKDAVNYNQHTK